ncbi:MAG: hypothetical protein GY945_06585 [Rhodobacteraceae bacterium]|nr:hypothetical protein [Paracoccaceae bacterium]
MNLHATCVAFGSRGVVISGKSGTGKSALALELIALGATLVSDDLTWISLAEGMPVAHAPQRLAGVIEARNVGLLKLPYQASVPLCLLVDMDRDEDERLPHSHITEILGASVQTIYRVEAPYFPAAVKALVTGGRYA